jgi:hypothetical protein
MNKQGSDAGLGVALIERKISCKQSTFSTVHDLNICKTMHSLYRHA